MPMSDAELEKLDSQEIWVDLYEAAEITGYNRASIRNLIQRINQQPEEEREIKLRKRSSRWELWLPDFIGYIKVPGRGAHRKRDENT
jgi:hypothetical protein